MWTRSWRRRNALIVVAAVTVVAGTAIFLLAPKAVAVHGWTAYTPLSPGNDFTRTSYVTNQHILGVAIAVLGLITLEGAVGFQLGRRPRIS